MKVTGLEDVPDGIWVRGGLTADFIRNKVADCFLKNAGGVPWQI